ncbi:bifunctional [glutamate--ammonia ligase]-adenylyl-L-tyrosine phosphorylase/[glutamate--ammonia-ligase] adenylyltransferase [Ectothiorhodospiraceae bacterium 2226]|nr:bifunctional [glutamate--ammonia ligase]-adenylyl-L-tyrosine phosphorylase/[glutamate--ammonia-ligase] adenylyltransferase [Ectothiorhodospiraceae bacterium 2226]
MSDPTLPEDLPATLQARVRRVQEQLSERGAAWPQDPALAAALVRALAVSDFVAQGLAREPALVARWEAQGVLREAVTPEAVQAALAEALQGVPDEARGEAELGEALRRARRRVWMQLALRDIAGVAPLEEVVAALSAFADAAIGAALARLYRWQCAELGTPCDAGGRPQHMVVLGMGKLGGGELNFSSDVDLIFAYPEEGETRGGPGRARANEEFFTRLGRRLIGLLSQPTPEGFVFRVDVRLRPFGDSGPLALSFDALEQYYQVHGREWERYAMLKARPLTGDPEDVRQLMALLRPFVYRRYLDFGSFESLREMKQLINQEVRRKGMDENVKLGAGGIREVEFIAQAFQLIRGGREPELQERSLLVILERLAALNYLPHYVAEALRASYRFLRRTEHRVQQFADQQTHALPQDPEGRARLAYGMGYASWEAFAAELASHRGRVHEQFAQVFEAPQTRHAEADELDLAGVWLDTLEPAAAESALQAAGFADPAAARARLTGLREGHTGRSLSGRGRTRLERLMPLLIGAVGQAEEPDRTLGRVVHLIEVIAQRTAYLALLVENPMALSQLVRLCSASSWVTSLLAQHPLLLDELLDPRALYAPPDKAAMAAELRARLARLDPEDLEQRMDALRHFKQAQTLRVAAADVAAAMPLMVVSDHLTWLAEVVLDEVLELAWGHLVARHGRPVCSADGTVCDKGFAIVAYGKLGGIELGYGSDLDVVFVHGGDDDARLTEGDRPIPNAQFFARLGQRIIHLLTAHTAAGVLYEVDLRLRPSGASGLLVTGLDALAEYQRSEAWTWEHQALVRARVVAGDPLIADGFGKVRAEVLSRARDAAALREDVRAMRARMREALAAPAAAGFDLKQGAGGIADIEFMVQYGVLSWAHKHPALLRYTDNIRLLAGFAEAGLLPPEQAQLLSDAYRTFRARLHRLTLQGLPPVVPADEYAAEREAVSRVWQTLMEP